MNVKISMNKFISESGINLTVKKNRVVYDRTKF